jgi:hypothetical protein
MLRLRLDEHLRNDGIHVTRYKTAKTTGKSTIYAYELVPERQDYVQRAIAARPCLSPFLFGDRDAEGYLDERTGTANGFDSIWARFMDRLLAETKGKVRFYRTRPPGEGRQRCAEFGEGSGTVTARR